MTAAELIDHGRSAGDVVQRVTLWHLVAEAHEDTIRSLCAQIEATGGTPAMPPAAPAVAAVIDGAVTPGGAE